MEMTDVTVVSRARTGDPDAFRLLVERHSQPIFRVAYRMTGNEHDADDVVQETFLRAYRQLDRFEERAGAIDDVEVLKYVGRPRSDRN